MLTNLELPAFEFPVIETYTQLAWVLGAVAIAVFAGLWVVRAVRRSRPAPSKPLPHAAAARANTPVSPSGIEFEKLVSVVANAGDQALSISRTQQAAAIKIDSTEMAVNRLVSDLSSIMTMPGGPAHTDIRKADTNRTAA